MDELLAEIARLENLLSVVLRRGQCSYSARYGTGPEETAIRAQTTAAAVVLQAQLDALYCAVQLHITTGSTPAPAPVAHASGCEFWSERGRCDCRAPAAAPTFEHPGAEQVFQQLQAARKAPAPVAAPSLLGETSEQVCARLAPVAAPCTGCAELKEALSKAPYQAYLLEQRKTADLRQAIDAAVVELEDYTSDRVRHHPDVAIDRALSALRTARGSR